MKLRIIFSIAALTLTTQSVFATNFRYNYSLVTGDAPANWQKIDSQYGPWEDVGDPYACTNWSPSTSTVGKGITFTQTATDCKQDQSRWVQDYQKNNITDDVEPLGSQYNETRTITGSDERDAIGVLENWMPFDPTYTSWVDTNPLYGCTAWSPNPAVYTESKDFTQTSATCKTDQERQRQDREKERYTDEIRNVGDPVVESQTLSGQSASRPYSVVLGSWTATGAPYDCTNWSPAVDTVGKGITFTQNATDCKLDQSRTRAESYKDHLTGSTVPVAKPNEARTLTNQGDNRQATGTLENWMPTTPTYTAWVNTSALNNCTNWSPDGASKTSSGTFTQTATNCSTDQTRNRQDREKEQYTGEIRDKGTPVVENQTLQNQSTTRSYTVTLGAWTNSGTKYACSNWSPAPSTVTIGQSFTQTATDCKQDQTRTRVETYVDHKSGQTVTAANKVENQTLAGQSSTQTATGTKETWMAATPTYTAWINVAGKITYSCSNWSPAGSTKTTTGTFTQTATDCKTDQTRTRQDREQESTTLAFRNVGSPVTENQTLSSQSATRSYTVSLGAWTNSGAKYACSNWSPAPSTVTIGQSFTQTATDCKQDQTRTRAESYVDHLTGSTVAVSVPAESQTLTGQSNTQTATGTKETWVAATPTYTAWTNVAGKITYSCTNWSPAGSTKTATVAFTQTATDCKTDQTRNRQDREQETTTLAYRNKGTPIAENQTLSSQSATRNYTVTLGSWTNSGGKYACSNWSPAPSTVTIGQSFTQTATDCKQDQTRTRAESYVDHLSGSTVAVSVPAESQTLTGQSNTQTATGTKETWVAAPSTYTTWANTSGAYNCSNWSPLGSAYSERTQFTQTATNCYVDQSRTRQDREQETTTLAYRNKGAAVTETQTVGNQWSTRSYLEDFNDWSWSGDVYNCTNWSPDPSTVNAGTAFTQTATDCVRNQTRGRMGYWWNGSAWTPDSAGSPYRTETRVIGGQYGYRGATGTKPTAPVCSYVGPTGGVNGTLTTGFENYLDTSTNDTYNRFVYNGVVIAKVASTVNSVSSGGKTYTYGALMNTFQQRIGAGNLMRRIMSYQICVQ